jgi:DNA-binding PadR family transcriptional regulator
LTISFIDTTLQPHIKTQTGKKTMLRDLELAFIKIHILYHAEKEDVFGIGLMDELARHGYEIGPGTLYPTLAKLERGGYLTCQARTVDHKQRKYYRATQKGSALLNRMRKKIEELHQEVIEQH